MPSTPRRLPSGSWNCYAYLGKDAEGKLIRRSVTRSSKAEARAAAVELEQSAPAPENPADPEMTLAQAMELFIEQRVNVFSRSTTVGYQRIRKNYLLRLQKERLLDITQAMIQREINACAEKLSPKSVANIHGFLSAVLASYRPAMHLTTRLPQKEKQEIVIPELSTIKALEAYAEEKGDRDLLLAVMFASQLGLRRSEICALTFADVQGGSVHINKSLVLTPQREWIVKNTPKSQYSFRTLPQTPQLQKVLARFSGAPEERLLDMTPNVLYSRFQRLQKRLGLSFRFHDLRHYNASVMILLGVPIFYIVRRLGHKDEKMVMQVYGHLIEQKQEDINEKMTAFFA